MKSTGCAHLPRRRRSRPGVFGRTAALLVALSLAGLVTALRPAFAAAPDADAWTGTWAAAPQPALPGSPPTFHDATLRLIVHASIGGDRLRLRFANTYGRRALELGAVRVARGAAGATIDGGSVRRVTFGGARAVVIAPGATIDSDPVALSLPAFADLAISVYLPRTTRATTSHLLALQSGYVARDAGDRTRDARLASARTLHSWPFLVGVDVAAPAAAGAVVVFGDSTVDGDGSAPGANHRLTDYLARALAQGNDAQGFGVLNEGIIGNRLLAGSPERPATEFGAALGESGTARFARDALGQAGVRTVVVRIGVNDLGLPGSLLPGAAAVRAPELIEGFRRLVAMAHARGIRIVATTLGPFADATVFAGYYSEAKERERQALNEWLRAGGGFDAVADLDAVLRDPAAPARLLPAFDSGDHLHPNDAGYAACAAAVAAGHAPRVSAATPG